MLANHVPSIEQLKAGLLEVFTEGGNKEEYFVAGGFAIVQPGSKLSINAVEAYKLDEFSKEVRITVVEHDTSHLPIKNY